MIKHDTNRIKAAVQYLVDSSYFKHHVRKLHSAVQRPRALPFKDEAEVLNELLLVGRQNREAMENLIKLAEFKRDDHNEYQRKFMAQKRQRERRIIAIEEILLGKTYTPEEARKALLKQYDQWNKEKAAHIEQCRMSYYQQFGQEASWEQRNQFIREFWALKDMELDMMEEEAQRIREQMAVKKRRIVVTPVERKWTPIIAQKLGEVLDRR